MERKSIPACNCDNAYTSWTFADLITLFSLQPFRYTTEPSLIEQAGKQAVQVFLVDIGLGEIGRSEPARLGGLAVGDHFPQQLHIPLSQRLDRLPTIQPLAVQPRYLQTILADHPDHIHLMAPRRRAIHRGSHILTGHLEHARLLHYLIELT